MSVGTRYSETPSGRSARSELIYGHPITRRWAPWAVEPASQGCSAGSNPIGATTDTTTLHLVAGAGKVGKK
jgi:hypothetical protein